MTRPHNARIRSKAGDVDSQKLMSLRERILLVVEPFEQGMRLDQFLASRMTWRSRTKIRSLIKEGEVELQGRSALPSRRVSTQEEIHVRLPRPRRQTDWDEERDLTLPVLYEDRWLLAIDKPAGIPVHPSGRLLHRTVITELHRVYRNFEDPERDVIPKLCHRLDLETSGVLLVAKDDRVVAAVGRQLAARTTVKEYLAIVYGTVPWKKLDIQDPLGILPDRRIHVKRAVVPGGEAAHTGVTVEQLYEGFSLLRIRLHTGRRHQIRVHLAHAGHALVGDKMYGPSEDHFLAYSAGRLDAAAMQELQLPRQALHAAHLRLKHPITGEDLEILSPLPTDLSGFLAQQRPLEK